MTNPLLLEVFGSTGWLSPGALAVTALNSESKILRNLHPTTISSSALKPYCLSNTMHRNQVNLSNNSSEWVLKIYLRFTNELYVSLKYSKKCS